MPTIDASAAPDRAIAAAVEVLESGGVAVIPTDTVYGLAAACARPDAVEAIFTLKRRPSEVALPVLVGDRHAAASVGVVDDLAGALADAHWPGPLTLVLWRAPGFTVELGGRTETVGVRCPDAALARAVADEVGPLAVTSANPHGLPTPETAEEAAAALAGAVALVVDGGRCAGRPSTVVDVTGAAPVVLRRGPVTLDPAPAG